VEENSRQAALDNLDLIDLPSDAHLDRLTTSAKQLLGVPFAAVTLVDHDRQTMASAAGLDRIDIPRSQGFCDIAIRRRETLTIEDTRRDHRYSDLKWVQGDPKIGFYSGSPIESPDGYRIGALCVMDVEPRHFTEQQAILLRQIALQVQKRLWTISQERRPDAA
jgi:GAF domain-containing protein